MFLNACVPSTTKEISFVKAETNSDWISSYYLTYKSISLITINASWKKNIKLRYGFADCFPCVNLVWKTKLSSEAFQAGLLFSGVYKPVVNWFWLDSRADENLHTCWVHRAQKLSILSSLY